ncbi:MAG TPA: hypothetical protein VIG80_07840, partial [Bacillaceae bacterium]
MAMFESGTAPSYFDNVKNRRKVLKALNFILLFSGSLLILSPVWWMVSTSLKTMAEVMQFPPSFLPEQWRWDNYIKTWNAAPFTRYTINTLTITVIGVAANVFVNAFIAYGFAKIPFRGKKVLFAILLSTQADRRVSTPFLFDPLEIYSYQLIQEGQGFRLYIMNLPLITDAHFYYDEKEKRIRLSQITIE